MRIEVVHVKRENTHQYPVHYIGRWNANIEYNASSLANPYMLKPYGKYERDESIEMYRQWLWGKLSTCGDEFNELKEILDKTNTTGVSLACWCAPLACHGDIIVKAAKWLEDHGQGREDS